VDKINVQLVELYGRQHKVAEFYGIRHYDQMVRLVRSTMENRPSYWVQIAAKARRNNGPWVWVGPKTAHACGTQWFSYMKEQ
jgi:hypothetical protein